jgi:hypothetical protein
MPENITIERLDFGDDGEELVVAVDIHNSSDRTWYAIAAPRRILYDNATKVATLELFQRPPTGPIRLQAMFVRPPFEMLEPGRATKLRLIVPRVIKRLVPAAPGGSGSIVELLPIHEAESLSVEIAVADVPFYPDSRDKVHKKMERLSVREWDESLAGWCSQRLTATYRKPTKGG